MPDMTVFRSAEFEFDMIDERLRELAYLNKNLEIILRDERSGYEREQVHRYRGGLIEFVQHLDETRNSLIPKPIFLDGEKEDVPIELSLQYNDGFNENIFTFVNCINTVEGGTHLAGFRAALTRSLNQYAVKNNLFKNSKSGKGTFSLSGEDAREGLTAVLSIKVADPQFEGQTKTKLGNGEVKGICDSLIMEGLSDYFERHPGVARKPSWQPGPEKRPAKPRTSSAVKAPWTRPAFPANWRTVPTRILPSASSFWWRATRPAALPSRVVTAAFRRFCPCVVK